MEQGKDIFYKEYDLVIARQNEDGYSEELKMTVIVPSTSTMSKWLEQIEEATKGIVTECSFVRKIDCFGYLT